MAQHYYSSTAVATALSAAITSTSATTFLVPDIAGDNGWPTSFPFTLAIDYGNVGVELVDVTSKGATSGANRIWNVTRAIDFTIASTHLINATVQHVIAARDFIEARQARSLQPVDSENTIIMRETTAGGIFTDSQAGDLTIRVRSGNAILLGVDGAGYSGLYVSNTSIGAQSFATGSLSKGSGVLQGTNYVQVVRSSTQAIAASTWTNIAWSSATQATGDDGAMWASGSPNNLASRKFGMHLITAVLSYSSLSGTHYIRIITQGGSVLAQQDTAVAIGALNVCAYLPGGGYYVAVQVNLTTAMNIVATASSTPSSASMTQVA